MKPPLRILFNDWDSLFGDPHCIAGLCRTSSDVIMPFLKGLTLNPGISGNCALGVRKWAGQWVGLESFVETNAR